jgi:hypothetical protein
MNVSVHTETPRQSQPDAKRQRKAFRPIPRYTRIGLGKNLAAIHASNRIIVSLTAPR